MQQPSPSPAHAAAQLLAPPPFPAAERSWHPSGGSSRSARRSRATCSGPPAGTSGRGGRKAGTARGRSLGPATAPPPQRRARLVRTCLLPGKCLHCGAPTPPSGAPTPPSGHLQRPCALVVWQSSQLARKLVRRHWVSGPCPLHSAGTSIADALARHSLAGDAHRSRGAEASLPQRESALRRCAAATPRLAAVDAARFCWRGRARS